MSPVKQPIPLTPEALELCPYGDPKCRLCGLPAESIKDLNKKWFDDKFGYNRIRIHIKEQYRMGVDFTDLNHHFNRHVLGKHKLQHELVKRGKIRHPEVVEALQTIDAGVQIRVNKDIEKAYDQLVKMAGAYTHKVRKLQEKIGLTIDKRDLDDELDEELDHVSAMDLLEKLARLNKEARDFVKEVSALRAPKVMVAQILEGFIDSVILEMGKIVTTMCGELQYDITAEHSETTEGKLAPETFANIFKKTAVHYRERMINLKRQKMADAMSALQDMEKII